MILGNLNNIEKEIEFYPKAIQEGIQFLLEHSLRELPSGRTDIDGEKLFAKVSSYATEPTDCRRPERHERYIDVQCIVEGKEKIGFGRIEDAGRIDTDDLVDKDILYYDRKEGMADENFLSLSSGMFAIFFPWDVHRPNCSADGTSSKVKKVVIKISMTALQE